MDITENLRAIRKAKGLSQADVAELLGTTQQQYSKYENGTHELPISRLIILCNYYQVSADWLLGIKKMEVE